MRRSEHIIRQIILTGICLLYLYMLEAQHRQYIRHITPEEGLVSRSVLHAIHQRDGRVWVGTNTGLQLYDGHHFYSIEELSQQSLPELHTIDKMQMWDDTMIYCRANHHFFRINTSSFSVEKLDSIYGFASANSEFLDFQFWDRGLLVVIARDGYLKLINNIDGSQVTLDSVPMKSPFYGHNIFVTDEDIIWSSENVGVRVVHHSGIRRPVRLPFPQGCLLVDSRRRMWIKDQEGFEIREPPYLQTGTQISLASGVNIRMFVESSDGAVWIMGSVLFKYTSDGKLQDHSYALDDLRIKLIRNMCEDADGNLWFLTADGILLYFEAENVFRNYLASPKFSEKTEIRNIYQGVDGKIYANPANPIRVIYQLDPVAGTEAEIIPNRRDKQPLGPWQYGYKMVYDPDLRRHWGIDSENGLCLLELPS